MAAATISDSNAVKIVFTTMLGAWPAVTNRPRTTKLFWRQLIVLANANSARFYEARFFLDKFNYGHFVRGLIWRMCRANRMHLFSRSVSVSDGFWKIRDGIESLIIVTVSVIIIS